jgi:hypothetical protein
MGLLVAAACAQSVASDGAGETLRAPVPGLTSAELGAAVNYWNESGPDAGVECRALLVHGELVEYVAHHYAVEGHLFAFRCVASESAFRLSPGQRYGSIDWRLSTLVGSRLEPISIPGWSLVASPSFQDSYVAYWQVLDGRVSAAVYHLLGRRIVASKPTRLPLPRTDFRDHFPQPAWRPEQRTVEFHRFDSPDPLVTLSVPE